MQAAQEIQEAARGVVEENRRLRAEVEEKRRSMSDTDELNAEVEENRRLRAEVAELRAEVERLRREKKKESERVRQRVVPVCANGSRGTQCKNLDLSTPDTDNTQPLSTPFTTRSSATQPNDPSPPAPLQASSTSMTDKLDLPPDRSSCAFAVAVLSGMRADVSPEDLKAELGCRGDVEECSVDNGTLFGAVDRYS